MHLDILAESQHFIALNKPAGLLTIPDRAGKEVSLKQLLQERFGVIFTVHRLDRDTSGVVVFAKNEEAHKELSLQFEQRETKKIYQGLVLGRPLNAEGLIAEPIAEHPTKKGVMTVYRKGKESFTEYKVLEQFRLYSWMEFRIFTGRTHQIRVHMKHLGHPIVADEVYGDGRPVLMSAIKKDYRLSRDQETECPLLARLALHSVSLDLNLNGESLHLEAPLPRDLKAVLQQLRKNK